jgi:uncharacterized protein YpmS
MKARYLVLGALAGVVGTTLAVAVIMVLTIMGPLPEVATPLSASSSDVVVSTGENYLSTAATDLARSEEPSIERVVVDVRPEGRVDMTVVAGVTILGVETDVNVTLISLVQAKDGRLQFSLEKIGLGGIGIPLELLPGSLRAAIKAMEADANETANSMLAESGLVPASATTDDSSITVALRAP